MIFGVKYNRLSKILRELSLFTVALWCYTVAASAQEIPVPDNQKIFRIGFATNMFGSLDKRDAQIATDFWLGTVLSRMSRGYVSQSTIFETVDELKQALLKKQLEAIYILSLDYLRMRDEIGMQPILASSIGNSTNDRLILLTRKADNITAFSQLRDKRLLIEVSGKGDLCHLWVDTLLMKHNLPIANEFFASYEEVRKVNLAVFPLCNNGADACVVTRSAFESMAELYPLVGEILTPLETSHNFLRTLICIRPDFNEEDKQLLIKVACDLHKGLIGRQILMLFQRDKLVPFQPEFLDGITMMLKEYNLYKETHKETLHVSGEQEK